MLSYAIQNAGYDFDQVDPQGSVDLTGFMQAIDEFPWREQHLRWNRNQEGALPTLVLECEDQQRQLWVTALGDDLGEDFQLQSVSSQMRKGFWGKPRQERNVVVFNVTERKALNLLCALFSQQEFEALDHEVERLAQLDADSED